MRDVRLKTWGGIGTQHTEFESKFPKPTILKHGWKVSPNTPPERAALTQEKKNSWIKFLETSGTTLDYYYFYLISPSFKLMYSRFRLYVVIIPTADIFFTGMIINSLNNTDC